MSFPLGLVTSTGASASSSGSSLVTEIQNIASGVESLFGAGGSQTDQQRKARVNYFYQLGVKGNVGAIQVELGAPSDVAADESVFWNQALQQTAQLNPAAYQAALVAGPVRFSGQGDTATSYPHMQAYATNWAKVNAPVVPVTGTPPTASTPLFPGISPLPVVPGNVQGLPLTTIRAPYNWTPVAIAAGAGALALFALAPRRRGRR